MLHFVTLVNNADHDNPEHIQEVSSRRSRAIRAARKLKAFNPNVMLFAKDGKGVHPVSLRRPVPDFGRGASFKMPMPHANTIIAQELFLVRSEKRMKLLANMKRGGRNINQYRRRQPTRRMINAA